MATTPRDEVTTLWRKCYVHVSRGVETVRIRWVREERPDSEGGRGARRTNVVFRRCETEGRGRQSRGDRTGINTPPSKDDDRMLWQSRFNLKFA